MIVVEDVRPSADGINAHRVQALEQVANRPIAHHVLDALAAAGIAEIVVVSPVGAAGEIRESLASRGSAKQLDLAYLEQRGPVDLISALALAAPVVGSSPCVVHAANGLAADPLAPLLGYLRGDAPDMVVLVHQGEPPIEHLSAGTLAMLHLAELDPTHSALGMAGICLFGHDALRIAHKAPWRADGGLDLTILAERIGDSSGGFHVLPTRTWHRYAGDPVDLLELNRIALDRLEAHPSYPPNHGNQIEGRVWIHERAGVRASVIVGPTVIGPNAEIADSYIGPYTSVGAGARIEGSEIERSIIAPGASIMHVGGRLISSVVGRNARVFRDFSVPRAMRLHVGDDTEIALC